VLCGVVESVWDDGVSKGEFCVLRNKNTPFISYFFPPNKRNIQARSGNHTIPELAVRVIQCKCVFVALGITASNAHSLYMYCHLWLSAVPYFSTLSHEWHEFRRKKF
jgi:hypothetical protein